MPHQRAQHSCGGACSCWFGLRGGSGCAHARKTKEEKRAALGSVYCKFEFDPYYPLMNSTRFLLPGVVRLYIYICMICLHGVYIKSSFVLHCCWSQIPSNLKTAVGSPTCQKRLKPPQPACWIVALEWNFALHISAMQL